MAPAVSGGRCWEEQRRGEDDGEGRSSDALHAETSGGLVLPPLGVILGGVMGEGRVRRGSPWLSFLPMRMYALVCAWTSVSPHTPITVVIAHFDDLLGRGLGELIEGDPSLTILAADVEHGRIPVVLRAHRPDVAILDVDALGKLAEVRELSSSYPATRLVLLGNGLSTVECAQLLAFGASACLGRDIQSRDVINAIHLASRGLQVIPRTASSGEVGRVVGGCLLTRREAEVLPLLQEGRSNAQIAIALEVGVETVRTHARNIYRKLGVSSRRELAAPSAPDPGQQPASAGPSPRRRVTTPVTRPRRGHGLRHS
jgi:DNA-binding NarL/FixJ family response regulator